MKKHIYHQTTELLQQENCVIWPGLGAFVVDRKQAKVHQDGRATAPVRFVRFNAKLRQNDGVLFNALSVELQQSFKKIEQDFQKFSETFKKELSQTGQLLAPSLGTFIYENGHLHFMAEAQLNIALDDDYALSDFVLKPLKGSPSVFSIKPALKWAAILAVPLVAGFMYFDGGDKRNLASFSFFNEATVYTPAEKPNNLEAIVADEWLENPIIPEHFYSNTHSLMPMGKESVVLRNEEVESQLEGQYLLVVGCFRSLENAEGFVANLDASSAKVAGVFKGLFRVAYSQHQNRKDALKALRVLRNQKRFKNAWISRY